MISESNLSLGELLAAQRETLRRIVETSDTIINRLTSERMSKENKMQMPCGFVRERNNLKRSLAHYRACSHPACKSRLEVAGAIAEGLRSLLKSTR